MAKTVGPAAGDEGSGTGGGLLFLAKTGAPGTRDDVGMGSTSASGTVLLAEVGRGSVVELIASLTCKHYQ